jgi:hypothetical protein
MTDNGFGRLDRRAFLGAVLVTAAGGRAALGQEVTERRVDPLTLPLDKKDVWTLHFRYKPPRIEAFDLIDRNGRPARKNIWYMWFQVYNRNADPQYFIPEFELVTKDLNTSHLDEPQPFILEQIRRIEDKTGILNLQTTISISKRPVPLSKPDAIPRMVSGVAIWTDIAERAPRTNKFSVYIAGLSNGLATEQTADGEVLVKRKTLQINFLRPTDDNNPEVTDVKPDDANGPAESWIYRTSSKIKATPDGAPPKVGGGKNP